MTQGFYHLDQDIFNAFLNGESRALLLRNPIQGDPSEGQVDDGDQWLVQSCRELDFPAVDEDHPFAIAGFILFFQNEQLMAEFCREVERQLPGDIDNIWYLSSLKRFLGQYLLYPAGAIEYALAHPEPKPDGEIIVRTGMRRFRTETDQVDEDIENFWFLFPDEDPNTSLELVQPLAIEGNQRQRKKFDIRTHDNHGLQHVINECITYQLQARESRKKDTYLFREMWKK